jgi:alkanesulfonate monooxygenase SsuD/methylene tetrahydromethanopterin reductase-like flavin-dependent oxidoreductase (luciferase family)
VQLSDRPLSAVREEARGWIAAYGVVPVYNRYFARQGFAVEAERLQLAWEHRSRGDARLAVTDSMVDAFCILGDHDSVLRGLEALQLKGVTTILLSPLIERGDGSDRRHMVARLRALLRDWSR